MRVQNLDWASAFDCVLGTLDWVLEDVSGAAGGEEIPQGVHPLPSSNLWEYVDMLLAGHGCFSKSLL